MSDPTATTETTGNGTEAAKNHFTKALEEAMAGAQALGKEAQTVAEGYREKFAHKKDELTGEAKVRSDEAREKAAAMASEGKEKASEFAAEAKIKATDLANQAKGKTSQALAGLGKIIDDNVTVIDEKVGPKYGEYVRTASKSMSDAAVKLDEKSLDELGEDAVEFVRKSPGLAVGMAVAAGFMLGRLFKGK
jgi:ElaB/YqjD/DUF883 family membrane-anchored ribosome-binding protein